MSMDEGRLVLEITAYFVYSLPPVDTNEKMLREQINIHISSAARKLQPACKLLVLEMMKERG